MKIQATSKTTSRADMVGNTVLAVILILVPFHALLTVAGSLVFGHYELLRLWKEFLLLVVTPLAAWRLWKSPDIWRTMRRGWLFWALVSYVALQLVLGLSALYKGQVNLYAMGYAWVVNIRPVLVLLLAWIFALSSPWLYRHWKQLLLVPAVIVMLIGLLQAFVLPYDAFSRIGYGPDTIEAYETVDNKIDYIRIQSSLRGANPLGAYLVLVLAAVAALLQRGWGRGRDRRHINLAMAGLLAAGTVVLLFTYSRSAYIGLALSVMAILALLATSRMARRRLVWGMAVLAVLAAGGILVLRDNDYVQNALFHSDETSTSATSSNEVRSSVMLQGFRDVLAEPFGRGPGTAGPASVHNDRPARVAENYYLQVGQETGWLGLGLFITILASLARRLWRRRDDALARSLLAALVGLSFVNLVQHAWTDDTLAMLWWGFAGIALAIPWKRPERPVQRLDANGETEE